jgi:enamine deaminase RidA (YjgF/YER057c/UK114 family)
MSQRTNIPGGSPFEPRFGFSRAVKVGNMVFVAGSTALQPDGTLVGPGDAYAQGIAALKTIETALGKAGASLADVVRTRVFITDIAHVDDAARAHQDTFGDILPASTLVEITGLMTPEMLIEIEADAVIAD